MLLLGPANCPHQGTENAMGSREEGSGEDIEQPAEEQPAAEQPAEDAPVALLSPALYSKKKIQTCFNANKIA
jgi:hypothetical protein